MHRNGNYRRTFAGLRLALAKWVDDAHSPVNDEAILHVFRPQDTAAGAKRRDNHARIRRSPSHNALQSAAPRVRIDVDGQNGPAEGTDRGKRLPHLSPWRAIFSS